METHTKDKRTKMTGCNRHIMTLKTSGRSHFKICFNICDSDSCGGDVKVPRVKYLCISNYIF